MRKLAVAHLTFPDVNAADQVSIARAAGLDAIEMRIMGARAAGEDRPLWQDASLLRETEARLRQTGLEVLSVTVLMIDAETRVQDCLPAFELAQRFGARNLLSMAWDADEARFVQTLASLCEAAQPYGVTLCLEFARYTAVPTIAAAARMIGAGGASNARVMVDALHLARSGGRPADVLSLDSSLLSYLQICDARPEAPLLDRLRWEAQNDRLLPGEGALPLADIVRTLPSDAAVSVETPCLALRDLPAEERLRRGVDATRALLGRIGA